MTKPLLKTEIINEPERFTIRDAYSEKERQAIYRFRYQIQVVEMKRKIPYADHRRKRIFDNLDSQSCLAYAEVDGRIIGTARIVLGGVDDFPEQFVRVFALDQYCGFAPQSKNMCFATKLMVHPDFRKTSISYRLMAKTYELARQHNVQFSFSGSNPYLIPMYEQLGYRQIGPGFQDRGYGYIIPTLLLTEDIEYLAAVRSPYLRVARKMDSSPAAKLWMQENIPDAFCGYVGVLAGDHVIWDLVTKYYGNPAEMPVLKNLSKDEAVKFLQLGTPFECLRGNELILAGDVCNELYILLDGALGLSQGNKQWVTARPGDIVGSIGLLSQTHHRVSARAIDDCKLLAISRFSFEKLLRSYPDLAEKLNLGDLCEEG